MTPQEESCERLSVRIARLEEKHDAMSQALAQAKQDMDRRMEDLNDVRLRFLPRELYDREHGQLTDRVAELEKSKAGAVGTMGAYSTIVALLLALAAIAIHFWK